MLPDQKIKQGKMLTDADSTFYAQFSCKSREKDVNVIVRHVCVDVDKRVEKDVLSLRCGDEALCITYWRKQHVDVRDLVEVGFSSLGKEQKLFIQTIAPSHEHDLGMVTVDSLKEPTQTWFPQTCLRGVRPFLYGFVQCNEDGARFALQPFKGRRLSDYVPALDISVPLYDLSKVCVAWGHAHYRWAPFVSHEVGRIVEQFDR